MIGQLSSLYCINPHCPGADSPLEISATVCPYCQSKTLVNDRYIAVGILGKGGFGKTYEVRDIKYSNCANLSSRKVLKILLNNHPDAIRLFQREAEVLTRLKHPGIPTVSKGGYFKVWLEDRVEPLYCLVMEFVAGETLKEWLKRTGNLDQYIARKWLIQLVEIVREVHQQQYFHRDIKPDNIMLKPDGQLVLIDFGAVREINNTFLAKIGVNESITRVVSSGYTPPEQLQGNAVPQSDFYALGRTFIYLLTGDCPTSFKQDNLGRLLWRYKVPNLSQSFADLLDWMMEPLVGWRPRNTQEILDYLQKDWQLSSSRVRIKINWQKLSRVSLGVSIVLGLGLASFNWGVQELSTYFKNRGTSYQVAGQLYLAQEDFRRSLFLRPNNSQAWFHLGRNYDVLGNVPQAREAYQRAIEGNLPEAYSNLARLDILEGNYIEAIALVETGLRLNPEARVNYALIKNLGWIYLNMEDYAKAKTYLQIAINLDKEKAAAYCLLAQVLEAQGKPNSAIVEWQSCRRYASPTHLDEQKWRRESDRRLKTAGT